MDYQQIKKINQAAEKYAEAVLESYRVGAERSVEAQRRSMDLAQSFFERVIVELERQSRSGERVSGELAEQARRQTEAASEMSRAYIEAYRRFLGTMVPEKGKRVSRRGEG